MQLLDLLRKDRRFFGTCPSCETEFRIADAELFPIKGPLPEAAVARALEIRTQLKLRRAELKEQKHRMTERAEKTVESVNVGKIVEKIVPSFRSFSYSASDCRALFEPIDYVVFRGMTKTRAIEQVTFVDVKSGAAKLTKRQREIKSAIESGNVEFNHIPDTEEA